MAGQGVLVLGSTNTDLVIRGPRLPRPGETVLGGSFYRAHGGKGANQAVAAARAGRGPVTFISAVGNDEFGRQALAALATEGIDVGHVKVKSAEPTGVALILVDQQGENLISVASGANAELTPADIDALPDSLFDTAGVFLASLEVPWSTVRRGLQRARRHGLMCILNPAPACPEAAEAEALRLVDVLTPNEGEAGMLAGLDDAASLAPVELARRAAEELRRRGCRSIVVTLGRQGCLAVEDEGETAIPALPVEAVDATAAGDAFNGALAAGLAEGKSLRAAARMATAAAALAVTRPGAQPSLPTRDEIIRLMDRFGES